VDLTGTVIATKAEIEYQPADLFAEKAHRALKKISDDKLEKSSAHDLGILAGVCVDKSRLITGQSTSNSGVMLKAIMATGEVSLSDIDL
jgi:hypothetical protein